MFPSRSSTVYSREKIIGQWEEMRSIRSDRGTSVACQEVWHYDVVTLIVLMGRGSRGSRMDEEPASRTFTNEMCAKGCRYYEVCRIDPNAS